MSPEHKPQGSPCRLCGLPRDRHRKRKKRERTAYHRDYKRAQRAERPKRSRAPAPSKPLADDVHFIAIDGEGYTRHAPSCKPPHKGCKCPHLYVYMSASTRHECIAELENPNGLSSREVFDWLLALPKKPVKVGYSLGYDVTKWTEDLAPHQIFLLWRPDHPFREGKHGPRPLRVHGHAYEVNKVATRFAVRGNFDPKTRKWRRSVIVWDLFRFFAKAFTGALADWGVGRDEVEAIQRMKDARGNFRGIGDEEKRYCQSETRLLAELAETLRDACVAAGLEPKRSDWFGPGSLAALMLARGKAKEQIVQLARADLADAVLRAFAGGRFECSRVGPLDDVESYDLASAYPYAETQLPCLAHGKWVHVRGSERKVLAAISSARVACVRWTHPEHPSIETFDQTEFPDLADLDLRTLGIVESDLAGARVSSQAWGPFPYRTSRGYILFPSVCPAGGWVWSPEFLAAKRFPERWPNVHAKEAWCFVSKCRCKRPYLREVADAYSKRLEWGKEGRGLTLKLAINSRYGKRAQGLGRHPFRCLVAAGLITSTTRAALLTAIGLAKDPYDVASVSTDGLLSLRPLKLPAPEKTGTEAAARRATSRDGVQRYPLGAWEHKHVGRIFLVRPGMRFSLDMKAGLKSTAARGLGVRALHESRAAVLDAWKRAPMRGLTIQQKPIFHGGKTSIVAHGSLKRTGDELAIVTSHFERATKYGCWREPEPYKVSFSPWPKRPMATSDRRFFTWALTGEHDESAPYSRGASVLLNEDLALATDEAEVQPDGGGTATLIDGDV